MKLFSGCLWWGYEGSLKMLYRGLGAADWVCQSLNGMDEFQAALLGMRRQPENAIWQIGSGGLSLPNDKWNGWDGFQAAFLGIQRQPENTTSALSGCLNSTALCRVSPNPPSLPPTPLLPTSACAVPPTLPITHATWHKYRQQPRHGKTVRIDF